ncbi:MAG: hypothetical protein JNM57_02395 [Cyclobacteriaceae bacterium]|nr:hypothetical protein [Cyclobacteriaceae bacterium]
MNSNASIRQDLMDIIHIHHERVAGFNKAAYSCENLHVKMLLNKEVDQTRDSISLVRRLLMGRFDTACEFSAKGPLFDMWKASKPAFDGVDVYAQLLDFELAGLLTLQCYCLAKERSYIDTISKDLLEFQYQDNLVSYHNMKVLRETLNKAKHLLLYPYKKSA